MSEQESISTGRVAGEIQAVIDEWKKWGFTFIADGEHLFWVEHPESDDAWTVDL